jgi:putative FmdB family regulatory protein
MPVYEYGCNECSHKFEKFKIMAEYDVPLSEPCPSCYKVGYVNRLISGAEICDPVSLGVRKVPKGYNDVIRNIKKSYPGNNLEVRE